MKLRNILSIFLAFVIALTLSVNFSYAKSSKQLKKEKAEKEEQREEGKKKSESVSKQIEELQADIEENEVKVNSIMSEIDELEANIEDLRKDLKKKEKKLDESQDDLNVRLRNMYKGGSISMIDVLLASDNVQELLSNAEMVKEIYKGDRDAVKELKSQYDAIKAQEEEMTELKSGLDDEVANLKEMQSELSAKKKEMSANLKSIQSSNNSLEYHIDSLESEISSITSTAKSGGYAGGSTYSKGKMRWPASGRITSEYAWRNCPFHGRELHGGIDIANSTGTPIYAAKKGKVISAGYSSEYGNVVMISHGGGVVTLYAHNSKLLVSEGQTVKKGQKIARMGSTGNSTGSHCHFEVRVNGKRKNPRNYLP